MAKRNQTRKDETMRTGIRPTTAAGRVARENPDEVMGAINRMATAKLGVSFQGEEVMELEFSSGPNANMTTSVVFDLETAALLSAKIQKLVEVT